MSPQGDDAQRDMERRALRNVRGLLDKIEDDDRLESRKTIRLAVACGIVAIIALALVLAFAVGRKAPPAGTIVLPPPANAVR